MTTNQASRKTKAGRLARLLDFDRDIERVVNDSRQLSIQQLTGSSVDQGLAIVGVDEVGRGCLAGPVVAAAVLLPEISSHSDLARSLARLDDSKVMAPHEREEISAILQTVAVCAVGESSVEEIDQINILQASLLAMKRARKKLELASPVVLLVDGNKKIPGLPDRQMTVVKGDSRSASIAAASVIAKVYRDALMRRLSESYPQYLWHENKGYGSGVHRQAIREHGLTPWHRRSFNVSL